MFKYLLDKIKILSLVLVVTVSMTGCFKQGNLEAVNELSEPITLKYWRVFDGEDSMKEIIEAYKMIHPNVNIEYRKLRYEEYEQQLLEAWAEDRGPDMFSIHNTWVKKYVTKIFPMPETVKLPYVVERTRNGDIGKADYRQTRTWTPLEIRDKFAETVYQDVIVNNEVYGLPLSVDSLALYYNRTMLDNAQITKVPSTWVEIKDAVKKLTLQDEAGEIVQAGIALGGSDNINRATDIVALLMMQNGAEMIDPASNRATFSQASPYASDIDFRPGLDALRFYTDFVSPSKEVYTWNEEMDEATNAFISGKLAMMLGYAYQLPLVQTQGAKINIGVAQAPHINSDGTDALGTKVNMASYWLETVSKKTKRSDYAWDFLMFATSADQAIKYLNKTGKPTALRSLVDIQVNKPYVGPFASQVLTANSWYTGNQPLVAEEIFRDMISNVNEGRSTIEESVQFAEQRINQTL